MEIKRDQWGRYLLPDPHTGEERAWTRATTIANTLADRYALEEWSQRNIITGIGLRPDLYALAVSTTPDDKGTLHSIASKALEAASASSSANLGTALHRLTERLNRDEIIDVPEQWRPEIDAYYIALVDHRVKILPEYLERICVIDHMGIAGTFDNVVNLDGQLMVADLKTGANALQYGMGEIAAQLAIYANATHLWDGKDYEPMPEVSKTEALVIWLPVGQAKCELHLVDVGIGFFAVELALQVREWRNRKDLSSQLSKWEMKLVPPTGTDDW